MALVDRTTRLNNTGAGLKEVQAYLALYRYTRDGRCRPRLNPRGHHPPNARLAVEDCPAGCLRNL